MSFVIRTDKLSKPQYFAGCIHLDMGGVGVVHTDTIFSAAFFPSRKAAEKAMMDIGPEDYSVSECAVGSSFDDAEGN